MDRYSICYPKDEFTKAAESRLWNLFVPDWTCISKSGPMELRSLCALSVGLHPFFASPDWVKRVAFPRFTTMAARHKSDATWRDKKGKQADAEESRIYCERCKEAERRLCEFVRRLEIAVTELPPNGALPIAEGTAKAREKTWVEVVDFWAWAKASPREWHLPDEFRAPQIQIEVEGAVATVESMPLLSMSEQDNTAVHRPPGQQAYQEAQILRVIREHNHDPKKLPKSQPGQPGIKASVRKKLPFTEKVFDKAWERLRDNEEIADD